MKPPTEWTLEYLDPLRVKLASIESLFSLKHLEALVLHHHLPAAFSCSDLETIASNLSQIKVLDLFSEPHPVYIGTSNATLDGMLGPWPAYDEIVLDHAGHQIKKIPDLRHVLRMFGTKCSKLQSLSVFVCPNEQNPILEEEVIRFAVGTSQDDADTAYMQYFPNLKELSFGSSYCRNDMSGPLGLVLDEYIRPNTRITADCSWGENDSDCESDDDGQYRSKDDEYPERLGRGGRIPLQVESTWKYDVNGKTTPLDQAILVSTMNTPLVFKVSEFLKDLAMQGTMGGPIEMLDGEKRMPGVSFEGWRSDVTAKELKERKVAWKNVAEFKPWMRVMKLQETRRLNGLTA